MLLQKGELVKILHKYIQEETPSNQIEKKTDINESNEGEEILNAFNHYLYKKYNYEALNQSLFIFIKNRKTDQIGNFSSMMSISEEVNPLNTNTLSSMTPIPQDKVLRTSTSNNFNSLTPYQEREKGLNTKNSLNSLQETNGKNFYMNANRKSSKILSKFPSKFDNKPTLKTEEQNSSISKLFTSNKC